MSLARKCDRCGKLYEFYLYSSTKTNNRYNSMALMNKNEVYENIGFLKGIDLCPSCMAELNKWLEGDNFKGGIR